MAPDCMRVGLHLRLIRVLAVVVDTTDQLRVEVESTRRWSRCPDCGFKCSAVHDRRRRKIRDLPVSGRATTLLWLRRRFVCGNCGERHLETHPEFEATLTRRLARAAPGFHPGTYGPLPLVGVAPWRYVGSGGDRDVCA